MFFQFRNALVDLACLFGELFTCNAFIRVQFNELDSLFCEAVDFCGGVEPDNGSFAFLFLIACTNQLIDFFDDRLYIAPYLTRLFSSSPGTLVLPW